MNSNYNFLMAIHSNKLREQRGGRDRGEMQTDCILNPIYISIEIVIHT